MLSVRVSISILLFASPGTERLREERFHAGKQRSHRLFMEAAGDRPVQALPAKLPVIFPRPLRKFSEKEAASLRRGQFMILADGFKGRSILCQKPVDHRFKQALLRGEEVIKAPCGHARLFQDHPDRGLLVAVFHEARIRGGHDPVPCVLHLIHLFWESTVSPGSGQRR